jgi:glucokinase-like ROK family protein
LSDYLNYIPAKNVKHINKHAALDLIRFTPGGISRVKLARRMSLSRAALTLIINDLLASGVICETSSTLAGSGRPPITLAVNPERGAVAGLDMGATHLNLIIANCAAQPLAEKEIALDINQGPDYCLEQAELHLRALAGSAGLELADLLAVGLGVPGPIMTEAGMVIAPPIMPGWDHFPIRSTLEKRLGCPVSLNNDAELGAIGEWAYGAGRSARNLAYIKVGTGVGAGLLLDGHIYRGATGSAGEIGHLTMDLGGELCTCGNRGCLETVASGPAIARHAQAAIAAGKQTMLRLPPGETPLTAAHVSAAASRGDLVAQQVIAEAGAQLGVAIAGLVNFINPNMVVVGGGVAEIGDLFLEPVRREVHRRSLPASANTVQISAALLGRRSIGMGAVVQALSIALHRIADSKTPLPQVAG